MIETYITTGFIELDCISGGIKPGDLVVLASRPAMGKSTLLSNIFASNIIQAKTKTPPVRCAYFSFEHTIGKVRENIVTRIGKYDFETGMLRQKKVLSVEETNRIKEMLTTMQREGDIDFYENDGADATLFYIALNAAEKKYQYGLDVIFIDSFEMLSLYDGSGKNVIASRLKQLAEKLNVAVIITAQMGRPKRNEYPLENINLQLVRRADKIIAVRRLDVTATYKELSEGYVKKGDTLLTVMKNIGGGSAKVCFDYDDGGFFE